ncbi:hypothetical protein [Pedobacter sp. NJ-S-72]
MKKKLIIPGILLCFLTIFIPFKLYAQRFILLNNNKVTYQNITKGDSAFFNKNFKKSIKYYNKLMINGYDEHVYLNQVQNYLGDQDKGKVPLMELWPVENPEKLDEKRKEVGLIPINEYLEMMKQLNGWK